MERYGFKFPMYAIITTKVKSDVKGMIVGRQLEECSGGIQRHYLLRLFFISKDYIKREPCMNPARDLSRYNECELELAT